MLVEREQNILKEGGQSDQPEKQPEMKAPSAFEVQFASARQEDQKRRARRTFRLSR